MLLRNEYILNLPSWKTEQISLLSARENKTWLKKYESGQCPQQKRLESDGRITPGTFVNYFEQFQVSASVKLSKFCRESDALKVLDERCIAASHNMAKVCSPIIKLNKS